MRILTLFFLLLLLAPAVRADGLLPSDFYILRARFNQDLTLSTERASPGGFNPEDCEPSIRESSSMDEIIGTLEDISILLDPRSPDDLIESEIRSLFGRPEPLSSLAYQAALEEMRIRIPQTLLSLDPEEISADADLIQDLDSGTILPHERRHANLIAERLREIEISHTREDMTKLIELIEQEIQSEIILTPQLIEATLVALRRERESAIIIASICRLQEKVNLLRQTLGSLRSMFCKFAAITGPRKVMPGG